MSEYEENYDRSNEIAEGLTALPYHIGGFLCGFTLFIIYVLLGRYSYQFVLPPGPNAVFWMPSGLVAFIMIYFRWSTKLWPFFLVGLFAGEYYLLLENKVEFVPRIFWSVSNMILALTLALLSRRMLGRQLKFTRVRHVFAFLILIPIAVIPGGLISAAGAVLGYSQPFMSSALSWALSDALGILLIAPLLFAWTSPRSKVPGDIREAIILGTLLITFSMIALLHPNYMVIDRAFFSFLIFFAAWAAIRFGARGVTLAIVVIDLTEVWATMQGHGTFYNKDLTSAQRLLTMQLLVANVAILMLILAAALEEQMSLRSKAESAIKIRDDFISVASHELKTPLTSLTMEIQILNNYIMTGKIRTVSEERLKRLARISELEIKRFSNLINDLLDVSRISSGRFHFNREKLNLLTLVHEAVTRLEAEVNKSGSTVTVTGQKDLFGMWDKARTEQVITNLLSNAIKYGKGRPIIMDVHEEGGRAVLLVQDQGVGIPIEDQARIFHRFERAVSAKEYSGLGLGLFIARQIVEAHGGSITVESEIGLGSLFRVELPLLIEAGKTHPYWQNHGDYHGQIFH